MSDERWIRVEDRVAAYAMTGFDPVRAYDAAEGQRVESIRWCETHGQKAIPGKPRCEHGFNEWAGNQPITCRINDDATLILPPKAGRQCADGYCRSQPACPEGTCREGKP